MPKISIQADLIGRNSNLAINSEIQLLELYTLGKTTYHKGNFKEIVITDACKDVEHK